MPKTVDTTKLTSGTDGLLFVEYNGELIPMLEVENFNVTMNITTVQKNFVGNIVTQNVPSTTSFALVINECVVRDEPIIDVILDNIKKGIIPIFHFQSVLKRRDGQEQRYGLNNAVPSGEFGLQNVTPGEICSRPMNFALNSVPDCISSFKDN